jgi:hypothetical protein
MLADAGVAVTVLPATDLFLMGGGIDQDVPRGVTPAHRPVLAGVNAPLATNSVLNPFTPFGDCPLVRMANLYANVAQLGQRAELALCHEMITAVPRVSSASTIIGWPSAPRPTSSCSTAMMRRRRSPRSRRRFSHSRPAA